MNEHLTCPVVSFDHRDPTHTEPSLRARYAGLSTTPLSWSDSHGGFWIVSTYAGIRDIERRTAEFSSATRGVVHPPLRTERGVIPALEQDPPEQTAPHRTYVSWFSGSRLAALEPAVRALTTRRLDGFAAAGGGDFVGEVAEKLPVEIICTVLGIEQRGAEFRALSQRFSGGDLSAMPELMAGVTSELDDRRRRPRDDVLSDLLRTGASGPGDTDGYLTSFVIGAFVAGHETTLVAGTALMYELARSPELQERLVAEPDLITSAVGEALRLHAPVQNFFRTVTRDVVVHGHRMRAGDRVMLLYAAANLDPEVFEEPTEFRLDRPRAGRHLSFGHGVHRCAGAALAEQELRVLTAAALPHRFRLAGDLTFGPPTSQGSFLGLTSLPLVPRRNGVT